jgi:hypothetical protein
MDYGSLIPLKLSFSSSRKPFSSPRKEVEKSKAAGAI